MDPKDPSFVPYRLAGDYLVSRLKQAGLPLPSVGIICGSGLSGLSDTLQEPTLTVKYADIPGFPAHCTVAGHKGEVVFGLLSSDDDDDDDDAKVPTICFRGRFHSYEGHDMKVTVLPVYVMRCLNVRVCIITNAAGALNPNYSVGDVICVTDHLAIPQLAGKNPLIGPNDDELGPRFPATSNAYPEQLRKVAMKSAKELNMDFVRPRGVYCFVSGPMYESKAECRFLRSLGGDAVGMSTIPEVVAAHHCNMKALCLSLMTNQVVTEDDDDDDNNDNNNNNSNGKPQPIAATHAEVLEAVQQRSKQMQDLVQQIVKNLQLDVLPKLPPLRQVTLDLKKSAKRDFFRTQSTNTTDDSFLLLLEEEKNDEKEESSFLEDNSAATKLQQQQQQQQHQTWLLLLNASSLVVGASLFALGAVFGAWSSRKRPF